MLGIPHRLELILAFVLQRTARAHVLVEPSHENGSITWTSTRKSVLASGRVPMPCMDDLRRWEAMAEMAREGKGEQVTLASFVGSLYLLKAIVDNEDNPAVLRGLLSFYQEPTGDASAINALRIARPIVREATRRGIFSRND